MKSVLITGCNRGIGFALAKQLATSPNPPAYIFTTCRNPSNATALRELAVNNKNIHILEIDVRNFNKYSGLVKEVEGIVGDDGLNVLINNAGVSSKFTRIALLKAEQMTEAYEVNTIAPLMLTKAFLPLLQKASQKNKELKVGVNRAAVINISSVLASNQMNNDGGFYPYRCSKSALNTGSKSLSLDLKKDNILVTSLHPGWCKTDLGGKNAPLEVEDAVKQIIGTLDKLKEEHNGGFVQYDGKPLPW